jgi:hypothetical protein
MLSILLAAAATVASNAPTALPDRGVDAPRPNASDGIIYMPTPLTVSADTTHRTRLAALRTEALKLQAIDGGTLTPEHHAQLQTKLDRIQLRYAEMRRRADLFSVDSNGRAQYTAHTRPSVVFAPNLRRTTSVGN